MNAQSKMDEADLDPAPVDPDAELVHLASEAVRLRSGKPVTNDNDLAALLRVLDPIEDRIVEIEARGFTGLLAKVRISRLDNPSPDLIDASIFRDIERLAGAEVLERYCYKGDPDAWIDAAIRAGHDPWIYDMPAAGGASTCYMTMKEIGIDQTVPLNRCLNDEMRSRISERLIARGRVLRWSEEKQHWDTPAGGGTD